MSRLTNIARWEAEAERCQFVPRQYTDDQWHTYTALTRHHVGAPYLMPRIDSVKRYGMRWEQGAMVRPFYYRGVGFRDHMKLDWDAPEGITILQKGAAQCTPQ